MLVRYFCGDDNCFLFSNKVSSNETHSFFDLSLMMDLPNPLSPIGNSGCADRLVPTLLILEWRLRACLKKEQDNIDFRIHLVLPPFFLPLEGLPLDKVFPDKLLHLLLGFAAVSENDKNTILVFLICQGIFSKAVFCT